MKPNRSLNDGVTAVQLSTVAGEIENNTPPERSALQKPNFHRLAAVKILIEPGLSKRRDKKISKYANAVSSLPTNNIAAEFVPLVFSAFRESGFN
jgi:hypothetical protein